MLKVLIADRNKLFCDNIQSQLSGSFVTRCCHDGRRILEICHSYSPDVLVLDLDMPYLDGMQVLRTLSLSGKNPEVLATTACAYSDYVIQSLVRLGVRYVLPKPCTVTSVVSRVQEIGAMCCLNVWDDADEACSLLLSMGLRMNLCGFECVREALLLLMNNSNQQITKTVYPEVAGICGGNAQRVERAIRNAITDAWKNRDESVWRMFFTPGRDGNIPCPTNGDFITRMASCLKNKKIS